MDTAKAAERAALRTAELIASAGDGSLPVNASRWTVGELGAHLTATLTTYTRAVTGSYDAIAPYIPVTGTFAERLSALTEESLALEPERAPQALADAIAKASAAYARAAGGRSSSEVIGTPWYGPRARLPLTTASSLLLAEQLVHGADLATTLGRPWPIDTGEALLTLPAIETLLMVLVDRDAVAAHTAGYLVQVDDGPQLGVRCDKGRLSIEIAPYSSPDCQFVLTMPDLLMVVYGRVGLEELLADGRAHASGRRPDLAAGFQHLFLNP